MALLTDQQRFDTWAEYMARVSSELELMSGFTKQELRTALNDADQWVSDNQASFVTALSQPFRGQSTTAQKARLLTYVLNKRYLEDVN